MHLLYDENGTPLPHGNGDHHHHNDHDDRESGVQKDRTLALLSYMYDHNVHHAEELSGLVKQLEEEGRKEAAERIKETVAHYEQGNAIFHEALHMLEGIS